MSDLLPARIEPGGVPAGFAERVLAAASATNDANAIWDAATTLGAWVRKWSGHTAERRELARAQVFCEIELGQILGPNPGHGPGRGKGADPHLSIPKERIKEFRRYYGWREQLLAIARIDNARTGGPSRTALLAEVARLESANGHDVHVEDATIDLRLGDFRDELDDIADADAIITDPPYGHEAIPLFDDLGALAARILKPGGTLVAMVGHPHLPEQIRTLKQHLVFRWIGAYLLGNHEARIWSSRVVTAWKPLLIFSCGEHPSTWAMRDVIQSDGADRHEHPHGQSVGGFMQIVERFTLEGALVVDPFLGGGTTGLACRLANRRFVGCELDADRFAIARRRLGCCG
jgi:SAM-dependent methyltransferase